MVVDLSSTTVTTADVAEVTVTNFSLRPFISHPNRGKSDQSNDTNSLAFANVVVEVIVIAGDGRSTMIILPSCISKMLKEDDCWSNDDDGIDDDDDDDESSIIVVVVVIVLTK